ncbi:heme o synthase [bacterium]|jgi:heme o synthase|nr:heme o synthase [bacterium]MDA7680408.1 heme o synthase [bacterium]
MKISATDISASASTSKVTFSVLADLVKARLTSLVLLTTLVGFYLGNEGPGNFPLLVAVMLGTGFLAAGAATLNQYLERDYDRLMPRTQDRPIPSGNMSADATLVFGGVLSVAGLLQLAIFVNLLTSVLGAATIALYLFVYTPLKRITSLNTIVGAVPGALPPLMGWTAARGEIDIAGWSLFAILFFWQLPHFLAIAWMYKDEYGKAGYVMLPNVDPTGGRTGRQALSHTLGLLPISLCPTLLGVSGGVYFIGATVLTLIFIGCAISFSRELSRVSARRLFFCSIIYLPLLLGLMVFDKVS